MEFSLKDAISNKNFLCRRDMVHEGNKFLSLFFLQPEVE